MLTLDMSMPMSCADCMACMMGMDENIFYCTIIRELVAESEMYKRLDDCPIRGELVRCGNCKHYKDGMCYNPNTYDDEKTCGNTTADWFCADGDRKDICDEPIK